MKTSNPEKNTISASININDQEARIEKWVVEEKGLKAIRLSLWKGKNLTHQPWILSEDALIDLLHKAILAHVLSHDFIGKLRERMEI